MGKKGASVECPACGQKNKTKAEVKLSVKVEKKQETEILDANKTQAAEVHPVTNEVECPKCGEFEAYYWSKQMRAGDEPETQFYKCCVCKNQWRNYM